MVYPSKILATDGTEILIAPEATMHGWGSDRWKSVTYLNAEHRAAVRSGMVVLVPNGRPSNGHSGTRWRRVLAYGDRFDHRMPERQHLDALRAAGLE